VAPKSIQNHPKSMFRTAVRTVKFWTGKRSKDCFDLCPARAELRQRSAAHRGFLYPATSHIESCNRGYPGSVLPLDSFSLPTKRDGVKAIRQV
jgi:hypothetical protein